MRIVVAFSTADALFLVRRHVAHLVGSGRDVHIVCGPGGILLEDAAWKNLVPEGTTMHIVPHLSRKPSLRSDILAYREIRSVIQSLKPDVVHVSTPKASVLGMLAARREGVGKRIYTVRGAPWETSSVIGRRGYLLAERLAVAASTDVLAISGSLQRLMSKRLRLRPERIRVLGKGSSGACDPQELHRTHERGQARALLKLPDGVPIIGYVGRVTPDKGIAYLLDALSSPLLQEMQPHVLIVGPSDGADRLERRIAFLQAKGVATRIGYMADLALIFEAIDVLAFPSLREGFGNVVLEAACFDVPAVGFAVTGTVDSIHHGATGIVVDVGASALALGLSCLLRDPLLADAMGKRANARARADFDPRQIWHQLDTVYGE